MTKRNLKFSKRKASSHMKRKAHYTSRTSFNRTFIDHKREAWTYA